MAQYNLYAIDIDKGRNYYACGRVGYLARHCRNRKVGNGIREGRRLEYRQGNRQSNLKEKGNLIVFD